MPITRQKSSSWVWEMKKKRTVLVCFPLCALEDLSSCVIAGILYPIALLAGAAHPCCLSDFGCNVNPMGEKSLWSRLCLPDLAVTVTEDGTKMLLRPGRSTATWKRKLLTSNIKAFYEMNIHFFYLQCI